MKLTFLLIANNTPFVFVVPPLDLKIESAQEIEVVNIIDLGEKSIAGNKRVKRISFSTFIPGLKSPFFNFINPLAPSEAIKLIDKWKDEKAKVSLVVPEFSIFYECFIERLDFSITERTGDVDIRVELVERGSNKIFIDEVSKLFER